VPKAVTVPEQVIARVEKSVRSVYCDGVLADFTGTGFFVASGFVTASHVVAACPVGANILLGLDHDLDPDSSATVSIDDRTHDLALVARRALDSGGPPLRLESAPAYVGEPLALVGVRGLSGLSGFQSRPEAVPGKVVATNRTVQLTPSGGGHETLTDAIVVTAEGVVAGESGGPAIDAAGNVVGVIEGSSPGTAALTPAADLMSLG
jgi:S1-C subfamily serine protease